MQNNSNLNNIIEFRDVGRYFPKAKFQALSHISFSVKSGEFLCLIGPSGSGKTTILRLISGLDATKEGIVKRPSNVGMVFQNGALLPWLSVFDNVALALVQDTLSKKDIENRVVQYLQMTGLTELYAKYPRELSGGQRQRVGIARALASEPDVLLLDEPFSALDIKTTEELHRDLLKIWKETGKTIVMISHSIEEAVTLADRVALIEHGNLIEIFTIDMPRPRHERNELFTKEVMKIRTVFMK